MRHLQLFSGSMIDLASVTARAAQSSEPDAIRVEIGKMALNAHMISEEASISRSVFAPYVGQAWPSQL
jgi:hypothetical protein